MEVFISYSHHDKAHLADLLKYLSPFKQDGLFNVWTDRELLPGDKLDKEIQRALNRADIIFLILSQDFISSMYCYEVELREAIRRHEKGECRIFPILVRPCTWQDSPLQRYVLAVDAQPVSQAPDKDEAWLRIYSQVQKVLTTMRVTRQRPISRKLSDSVDSYVESLLKDDFTFSNRETDISLEDIFVWPDVKAGNVSMDKSELVSRGRSLLETSAWGRQLCISGREQAGKTTLAKMLCVQIIRAGGKALYLKSSDVEGKKTFEKILGKARELYGEIAEGELVVVFDDFDKIPKNDRFKESVVKGAERFLRSFFFTSDDLYSYSKLLKLFEAGSFAEIMPFSASLRSKLIERWHLAGREFEIEDGELEALCDRSEQLVDGFIVKNTVPPRPIYILMILQIGETSEHFELGQTAYGYCYQKLIIQYMEKGGVRASHLDDGMNYLSELAYFMYQSERTSLTDEEYQAFEDVFYANYFKSQDFKSALLKGGILVEDGDRVKIRYRYVFYYCAARRIADQFQNRSFHALDDLCNKLHIEKYANILIFVTHHTRSDDVIDEITLKVMEIFQSEEEADFSVGDFSHIDEISSEIPELVLEERNAKEEREKVRQIKDENEDKDSLNAELDDIDSQSESEGEDVPERLRQANQSYRAIEVLGQIIRNRKGSLKKDRLVQLADEGVSVGLRYMRNYLSLTKDLREDIIAEIKRILSNSRNNKMSPQAIERAARQYYYGLCYLMAYSVIHRITDALGGESVMAVFEELAQERRRHQKYSIARRVCDVSMSLYHNKKIPKREIEDLLRDIEHSSVSKRLLQEVIVRYSYLHTIPHKDKDWIATKLGIPQKSQNLLQKRVH